MEATLQIPPTWNLSWRQALPQVRRSLLLIYPVFKASKRYGMDSVKLYKCPNLQCNPCSSATEWTASVHTLHMSQSECNPYSKCYVRCILYYVHTCNVTYATECLSVSYNDAKRTIPIREKQQKHSRSLAKTMNIHTCFGINTAVHTLHMSKPLM